jgi:hypothetical protein
MCSRRRPTNSPQRKLANVASRTKCSVTHRQRLGDVEHRRHRDHLPLRRILFASTVDAARVARTAAASSPAPQGHGDAGTRARG